MYANVGKTDFLRFVATEAEYLCICLWGNCASSSVLLLFPLPPPPTPRTQGLLCHLRLKRQG